MAYTSFVDVFEYIESQYTDKIAVADSEQNISFGQLKKKAISIAATIQSRCEQKGPVVVVVDRTVDTVMMILGVLYTGNYYIPIDPKMPKKKIQSILNDSGARVILAKKESLSIDMNSYVEESNIINIGDIQDVNEQEFVYPSIDLNDPLYMVYTSGSTGTPKGVLKSHGAMINFIEAYVKTFQFNQDDVIGNQSPLFFDASAKDLYLMLFTGATLEILPTELFTFTTSLIEYMNERKITFISWVPTALSVVAQLNTFSEVIPTSLKRVFFVGEVMPIKHLNTWKKYLPNIQYVNLYGASELAGICCYYEVNDIMDSGETLPIGKPLCNSKIFLLDSEDNIIQDQETKGEICISSGALALQYFNDAEKTSEKFKTIISGKENYRIYKTGDIGKYNAEGNLIYVGRSDFQVKHRGHRIELGEIEAVANGLECISKAACVYNHQKSQIVLFCQMNDTYTESERDILKLLRGKVSDYMLPGKIIKLDSMPLNANGKIDRQLLKTII